MSRHIKEKKIFLRECNDFIPFWKLEDVSIEFVTLVPNTKVSYSTVTGVEQIRSDLTLYIVLININLVPYKQAGKQLAFEFSPSF